MNNFFTLCRKNKKTINGKQLHIVFLTVLLSAFTATTQALESAEKIFIKADRMQMNIDSGKSTYTGNVKISQGKLVLSGDKVTLKSSKEELERLIIIGKPARYNHVTENGENIKAESEHMVYIASQNKLVMTINAYLQQPELKLSSQKIIYDTQKRTVIAGDDAPQALSDEDTGKTQRVNITLTPKKPQTKESQP